MKELCISLYDRYGTQFDIDYFDIRFFIVNKRGTVTIFSKMYGMIGTSLRLEQITDLVEGHFNGQD